MRTGAPLSVLKEKNKTKTTTTTKNKTEWAFLFSVLSIPAFPTTLDDISPIQFYFAHVRQITPSDISRTCLWDKEEKPDASQTDEWQG